MTRHTKESQSLEKLKKGSVSTPGQEQVTTRWRNISGSCSQVRGVWSTRFDRWIEVASTMMRMLYWSAELKSEAVNSLVNLCSYRHLWSRALGSDWKNEAVDTSGEKWVPLDLWLASPLVIRWRVWEGLKIEPLLLHLERWLEHLTRMPPGCLLAEVFQAWPTGRRPWGRPKICWRDYISSLGTSLCHPPTWTQVSDRNWMDGWMT